MHHDPPPAPFRSGRTTRARRVLAGAARRATTLLLILGLLTASPGASRLARAQAVPADPAARMDAFAATLEDLLADLDPIRFDVGELGLELAFEDGETIAAYLNERVRYEPYPGLLRGAAGTWQSRAGNALDQAMLASVLLGDAGYEVRIARGTLSRSAAEALVAGMRPASRPALAADAAGLAGLGVEESDLREAAARIDAETADLVADADAASEMLIRELSAAGLAPTGVPLDEVVEEARDYFWPQYRLGPNDPWTDAHLAFDEPPADLAGLEVEATLDGEIPEELQHRFRFRVRIEQRLGDDLVVHDVMEAWERPVANMVGVPIAYTNMPDGLSPERDGFGETTAELLEATSLFLPIFDDDLAPGGQMFDLEGNTVPPEAGAAPAAGVVQNVGEAFGQAAGALAGDDDPDAFVALTAQWIDYTLVAPGGEETTHRRTVVDRIGAENRREGAIDLDPEVSEEDVGRALMATHTFMLAPGAYHPEYVARTGLAGTLAAQELVRGVTEDGAVPTAADLPTERLAEATRPLVHLNLYAAFDAAPRPEDVVRYRPAPALVVVDSAWDGAYARVDVVSNPVRAFRVAAGAPPAPAPEAALAAGAWETRVEGAPLAEPVEGVRRSAFDAVVEAREAGIPLAALAPAEDADLSGLTLPEASLAAIRRDLAAGYAVVAPRELPEGATFAGWWRVDPRSGETLGRGGDGRGVELNEYLHALEVEAALLKGGLVLAGSRGFVSCAATGSAAGYVCCLYENLILTGASVGFGAVLGAYVAIPALAMFVAMDLTIGTGLMIGGMAGWLPSMCSGVAGSCPLVRPTS